jgi:glycosyltransferase involved in cell wall biosynthesis
MAGRTKVSVITPCYKAERYIQGTIESVRHQTLTDWEHVIVDDGSPDRSAEIVATLAASDSRLRLVRQSNGGVARARNRGFAAASPDSEYLYFLDADDRVEPRMLQVLTEYLDAHPEVGLVYCDPILVDDEGHKLSLPPSRMGWQPRHVPHGMGVAELPPDAPETPFCSLFALTTVIPSISVIRRSVYVMTPGWDEDFGHVYEDMDLFLQIALRSRVHKVGQPLVSYRKHEMQSTSDAHRVFAQECKLFEKWDRLLPSLEPEQRKIVGEAKRFREGRIIPLSGWRGGVRHLQRGNVHTALRFWVGAGRRYLQSLLPSPRVRAL